MDGSESDIPRVDLDIMGTVSNDMNQWIRNFKAETVCKTHQEVTKEKLMSHSKETLANCLLKGYQTVYSHVDKLESSRVCVEKLKSELIAAQRLAMTLQQQLLDLQAKELNTMPAVVGEAVNKGIKQYSHIVSEGIEKSKSLNKEKLKEAVQEAVTEEDRSKNVVIFGLSEEPSEDLDDKVTSLFEEIEERPSFEATRVGRVSEERIRPVKVSLRNSDIAHGLLSKAKQLKETTAYRKVYIAPDRSPEERIKHRKLVAEMREQVRENPDQYFFIYAGSIGHRDRHKSETRVRQTALFRVKQTAHRSASESSQDER